MLIQAICDSIMGQKVSEERLLQKRVFQRFFKESWQAMRRLENSSFSAIL